MSEHLTPEGEQFLGLQGFEKGREYERTALLAKLRDEVENYWFVEIKQGCGCDYDPKQCTIHNLLAIIKKAGGEG